MPKLARSVVVRPWVKIALLTLIMIAILGWWGLWRHSSQPEMIERQLTSNSSENSVTSMALSRDGANLAYADKAGVFIKSIRTGETHQVALPPNFSASVDGWFPDESHLLVSRAERPGNAGLWSVSVFGGSLRKLADDASGGSFSPDGSHIAFHRGDLTYDGLWGREEWVMRSDGTDPVKVAPARADAPQVGTPTWSPDGTRIAYIRSTLGVQRANEFR